MQGKVKDWVNYHAQHHRLSDKPGDPHNPAEGKFWAWIGWLIWRDKNDLERPMARWIERTPVVHFFDRFHMSLSLAIHLIAPAVMYLLVWAFDGSLLLAFILHASAVVGRALQFHATTLGINVVGHLEAPQWLVWTLAIFTGGEAFHAHHHAFPRSVLHLPKNGIINRLVDYNGTVILILRKLRLADRLEVAPQFLEAKA
jgi:stearoyl-CoA desaturase (delta-9 desaturase)